MNQMQCNEWQGQLLLLAYGELDAQQVLACREHLAGCPACRAEFADLVGVQELLDQMPVRQTRVDLAALCLQIAARDRRARRLWRWGLGSAALAASLLVAASIWIFHVEVEPGRVVVAWQRALPAPAGPNIEPAGPRAGAADRQYAVNERSSDRPDAGGLESLISSAFPTRSGEDWEFVGPRLSSAGLVRDAAFAAGPQSPEEELSSPPATYGQWRRELLEDKQARPALRRPAPGA